MYEASGGEITRAWISRDEAGLGADAGAGRAAIEASDLYAAFRRVVDERSGSPELECQFHGPAAATSGAK